MAMDTLYTDSSIPVPRRVAELISRMTLREKIGQLSQRMFGWEAYKKCGDGTFCLTDTFRKRVEW
ncbi:MAG: hypothetical protein FWF29_04305, partial [Treponema sp.]|nr:hypothetical protein [Treponema sp.]